MKLSKKQKQKLYDLVHEEIMKSRIKIWKMRNDANISISEIDNIMSDLSVKAPQKATELFTD